MSRLTHHEKNLIEAARAIVAEHEAHETATGRTVPETFSPMSNPDSVEENGSTVRVRLINQLRYAVKGIEHETAD